MTTAPHMRLNALCPYFTMFPLDFPARHLADARPGEWVLDPFCGRGTTNFAARLHGLPTVGIDSGPVAVAIAQAKLVDVTPDELVAEAERILAGPEPVDMPEGPFWELAFHPRTLADLCRLREALLHDCDSPARTALRGLVLGILHGPRTKRLPSYLSNQMPRTYATKPDPAVRFWTRRGMTPPEVDVLDVIVRRARYSFAALPPTVPGRIIQADSREPDAIPAVDGGYRWVVTSPPYLGMRSYQPDQWLRLWFLGGEPTVRYIHEGQVSHLRGAYQRDLAAVWRNVAARCRPGARLVVRFGCLPTLPCDPRQVLEETLVMSGAPWRIVEVTGAGIPPRHRRQAAQFEKTRPAREEIDLVAELGE
ncbi:hypothetical protein J2Z79_002493 [Symbiobacterium terraclitae]|uniref:DNA methylase N-4/N-6 domain-containing protein n=1 Tax=Symbiobacterium terraclitae TaxID=557451 RepID=A0ABS4JU64_9FIRM|nr:DNA methyltransferase [Symbiobacterium terraclitae]MBP2019076.1 hypothetical protein [Symbiobacterium terraclitae]